MKGRKQLKQAFQALDELKQNRPVYISGLLGAILNGSQVINVINKPGFVYVRLRDNPNEVIQAFNSVVDTVFGLPVLVVRDEFDLSRYLIVGRDLGRYSNWGSSESTGGGINAYLPKHGTTHTFFPGQGYGGDVVWINSQQFLPLLASPATLSGTGGPDLYVQPYPYYYNGVWALAGQTVVTMDIEGLKPTGSSTAKMVLLGLDMATATLFWITGSAQEFDAGLTGTDSIFPYLPPLSYNNSIPVAGVRLVSGTAGLSWDNVYDVRPFFALSSTSGTSSSPGLGKHIIEDENSALPMRSYLNFKGANVWAEDDPANNRTNVSISGTASGGGGHTIQDEGTLVTARANLNFIGYPVWVEDDAGNDATKVIISGSSSGLALIDDADATVVGDLASLKFSGDFALMDSGGGQGLVELKVTGSPSVWCPDCEPTTPDSMDDEFSDASISEDWSIFNPDNTLAYQEVTRGLLLSQDAPCNQAVLGVYKAYPAGSDHTFSTKVSIDTTYNSGLIAGLLFGQDIGTPESSPLVTWGAMRPFQALGTTARGSLYPHHTGTSSEYLTIDDVYNNMLTTLYLRLRLDGTDMHFEWSSDGVSWIHIQSETMPWTPAFVGLFVSNDAGNDPAGKAIFGWFRHRTTSTIFHVNNGRRVIMRPPP